MDYCIGPFILMSVPMPFTDTIVFNEACGCAMTAIPSHDDAPHDAILGRSVLKLNVEPNSTIVIRDCNHKELTVPRMYLRDHINLGRVYGVGTLVRSLSLPNLVMHATILARIPNYVACACIPVFADVTKLAPPIAHSFASKVNGASSRATVTIADIIDVLGLTQVVDARIASHVVANHKVDDGTREIVTTIARVSKVFEVQGGNDVEIAWRNMHPYLETTDTDMVRDAVSTTCIPTMFITTATINKMYTFVFAVINKIVIIIHDGESEIVTYSPLLGNTVAITNTAQKVKAENMTIACEIEVARRYACRMFGVIPAVNIVLRTGTGVVTVHGPMRK